VVETFPPHKGITLGLDLQGGMHLVMEVDVERAVDNVLDRKVLISATASRNSRSIPRPRARPFRRGHDDRRRDREKISKIVDERFPILSSAN
jgi:hypothetical protein